MSTGRYARGQNALAICERCSKKQLRRHLVYDGQYPDLLVCPECWDPKHPQEYLPPSFDPVTLYDTTGDPDALQASSVVISWPTLQALADVPSAQPLLARVVLNQSRFKYDVAGGNAAIVES